VDDVVDSEAMKVAKSGTVPLGIVEAVRRLVVQVEFGDVVMDSSKVWALYRGLEGVNAGEVSVVEAESYVWSVDI
jgi:hypothetical protein